MTMATQKVWILEYVVGNPAMFSRATTAAGSPMKRREALDGAQAVVGNGGGWRVWVKHAETGKRIFESEAERQHNAAQPA